MHVDPDMRVPTTLVSFVLKVIPAVRRVVYRARGSSAWWSAASPLAGGQKFTSGAVLLPCCWTLSTSTPAPAQVLAPFMLQMVKQLLRNIFLRDHPLRTRMHDNPLLYDIIRSSAAHAMATCLH